MAGSSVHKGREGTEGDGVVDWFYDTPPCKTSHVFNGRFHGYSTRGKILWKKYLHVFSGLHKTIKRMTSGWQGAQYITKIKIHSS